MNGQRPLAYSGAVLQYCALVFPKCPSRVLVLAQSPGQVDVSTRLLSAPTPMATLPVFDKSVKWRVYQNRSKNLDVRAWHSVQIVEQRYIVPNPPHSHSLDSAIH